MLANKDLYEEIQKIEAVIEEAEKEGEKTVAAQLKSNVLILKLLHSLRTNSVTLMKHHGIDLEVKKRSETKEDK